MDVFNIAKYVDHTILNADCRWDDVEIILDDAVKFSTASACIPPSYVKRAKKHVGNALKICTVIGFPFGYSTTEVKVFETENAIKNGADEIDMVINIGWLKDKKTQNIKDEIEAIKSACGNRILKVIIETVLLTKDEIVEMCHIVSSSGADFIKTSTWFQGGGATVSDVMLMAGNISSNINIKASGGISTLEEAEQFISLGATRLGSSRLLALLEKIEDSQ